MTKEEAKDKINKHLPNNLSMMRKYCIDKTVDEIFQEIYHRDKNIELLNEEMLKLKKEIEELKL
jgi:peptidoglycan hydrolase CwlO-like protein